jgi:hypothetical protein
MPDTILWRKFCPSAECTSTYIADLLGLNPAAARRRWMATQELKAIRLNLEQLFMGIT